MAYTTINKSTEHVNTKLYDGNASTQTISGVGFQPDFTWLKHRNGATSHLLYDVLRGPLYRLQSNSSNSSSIAANTLTSWNSDGFALGPEGDTNGSGRTYASWNWKANGAGSANTNGSISSTVSVNTTSGFSIVKWNGTGSASTIGHGLSTAPSMIITKSLGGSSAWGVYNESMGNTKILFLNESGANGTNIAYWNNTSPTSSVFTVGSDAAVNHSGNDMIAYCFADVQGYSKFGSYTGNGSADGTFIYLGFKPTFCIIKRVDAIDDWLMVDNKRVGYNGGQYYLLANASDNEDGGSGDRVDILSNGLKMNDAWSKINASGGTYIYMAFGQTLVGSNNVPANAR